MGWSGARSPVPKAMPGCRVSVGSDGETSRLLKPSRRVRSVNVEIDHHGTDAPLRVAALLEGVSVGSGASAVRRRAPLAAGS